METFGFLLHGGQSDMGSAWSRCAHLSLDRYPYSSGQGYGILLCSLILKLGCKIYT